MRTRAEDVTIDGEAFEVAGVQLKNATPTIQRAKVYRAIQQHVDGVTARRLYKTPGAPGKYVEDAHEGDGKTIFPTRNIFANSSMDLVWEPGEVKAVPTDVANALVMQKCLACSEAGPLILWRYGDPRRMVGPVCCNREHARIVVGGLCPQLTPIGDDGHEEATEVARDMVPPPAQKFDAADLHERVMRKIAGAR
jgi:hypothetical protein